MNVQVELNRAQAVVQEVQSLLSEQRWNEAVTQSYYGMYCLARALVFSQNLPPAQMNEELNRLTRLSDEAASRDFNEEVARHSHGALVSFYSAVEKKLP